MTNSKTTCFTDEELALHALEEYLEEGEDRDEMEAFIESMDTKISIATLMSIVKWSNSMTKRQLTHF